MFDSFFENFLAVAHLQKIDFTSLVCEENVSVSHKYVEEGTLEVHFV